MGKSEIATDLSHELFRLELNNLEPLEHIQTSFSETPIKDSLSLQKER